MTITATTYRKDWFNRDGAEGFRFWSVEVESQAFDTFEQAITYALEKGFTRLVNATSDHAFMSQLLFETEDLGDLYIGIMRTDGWYQAFRKAL